MIRWLAAGAAATALSAATGANLLLVCLSLGLIVGALSVAPRGSQGTPRTIARLPLPMEQRHRRVRLAFGLGLTLNGIFPFVAIYRRTR